MNGKNKLNFIHEDLEKYSKEITGCIEASTGFIALLIGTMTLKLDTHLNSGWKK